MGRQLTSDELQGAWVGLRSVATVGNPGRRPASRAALSCCASSPRASLGLAPFGHPSFPRCARLTPARRPSRRCALTLAADQASPRGARGGCGGAGSAKQLHLVPVAIPVCRLPSCQACAVKGR